MKKFVLVNGFLELNNEKIFINETSNQIKERGGYIVLLFIIVLISLYRDLSKSDLLAGTSDYINIGLKVVGLLIIFYLVYNLIFKKNWSKNVSINEIKKIKIDKQEFETKATITFLNNRYKKLIFRTLENQIEPFINELKKRNSRINISYERI